MTWPGRIGNSGQRNEVAGRPAGREAKRRLQPPFTYGELGHTIDFEIEGRCRRSACTLAVLDCGQLDSEDALRGLLVRLYVQGGAVWRDLGDDGADANKQEGCAKDQG